MGGEPPRSPGATPELEFQDRDEGRPGTFWEGILGPLMEMPTAQLGDDLGLAFPVMEKAVTPPHPAPISLASPASPRQRRGAPFGWVAWSLGGVKGDRRSRPHAPVQTLFSPFPLPQGIGGGEKKVRTHRGGLVLASAVSCPHPCAHPSRLPPTPTYPPPLLPGLPSCPGGGKRYRGGKGTGFRDTQVGLIPGITATCLYEPDLLICQMARE